MSETQPTLTQAIAKIERAMGAMPYGGTYFTQPTAPGRDASPMDRLDRIEVNLRRLAVALAHHAQETEELNSELWRYRSMLRGVREFIDAVQDVEPIAIAGTEET
jgi:hypothetical protein